VSDLRRIALLGVYLPVFRSMDDPTSFKSALDVTQGHLIPWLDFQRIGKGWRSLGLSPDTILQTSTPRAEFMSRSKQHYYVGRASVLALVLGSLGLTVEPLRFRFGWMRNDDILFFFMSQLILPPVVLACHSCALQGAIAA